MKVRQEESMHSDNGHPCNLIQERYQKQLWDGLTQLSQLWKLCTTATLQATNP